MICPRCSVAEISSDTNRCELCGYTLLGSRPVAVQQRVAAGFALHSMALAKLGRVPVETFDASGNHDLIRRVADGADKRGPELVGHLLGVVQLLPTVVVSVVALALTAPWLPALVAGGINLANDILRKPIGVVGPGGRVERVIEPSM